MDRIILSILILAAILIVLVFCQKKVVNLSNKINLVSLVVFAVVAMLASYKVSDPDLKVLYSLGLIVSSGIGRYGTLILSKKQRMAGKNSDYSYLRQLIYAIIFIFGLLGLVM